MLEKIDLQLFADGASGDEGAAGAGARTSGSEGNTETKTFEMPKTQEDFDKFVLAATSKAVADANEKMNKDFEERLATEKAEAEKLAKMTASEKEKELSKKREDALTKKEREIFQKELELKTADILREKNLPADFRAFVMGADEAVTKERVESFSSLFQKAIEEAVNEKLKGKSPTYVTTPPANGAGFFESVTKNQYRK